MLLGVHGRRRRRRLTNCLHVTRTPTRTRTRSSTDVDLGATTRTGANPPSTAPTTPTSSSCNNIHFPIPKAPMLRGWSADTPSLSLSSSASARRVANLLGVGGPVVAAASPNCSGHGPPSRTASPGPIYPPTVGGGLGPGGGGGGGSNGGVERKPRTPAGRNSGQFFSSKQRPPPAPPLPPAPPAAVVVEMGGAVLSAPVPRKVKDGGGGE